MSTTWLNPLTRTVMGMNGIRWGTSLTPASPAPVGAYQPLTGVTLAQNGLARSDMAYVLTLGQLIPTGGVGPFVFGYDGLSGKYGDDWPANHVKCLNQAIGTTADVLSVTVRDGLGATVTSSVPINKTTDLTPTIFLSQDGFGNNASAAAQRFTIIPLGGDHYFGSDTITMTDPSGMWTYQYGTIVPVGPGAVPPGNYPLALKAVSATTTLNFTRTITIAPYTPIRPPLFVLDTVPISTTSPLGTVVGRMAATTPANSPQFTLSGPGLAYCTVNNTKRIVTLAKPIVAGALTFTETVTDGAASASASVTVTVPQGTALPPTNMSFTPSTTLDNWQMGQTVGTPAVTGMPAGASLIWRMTFPEFYQSTTAPNLLPVFAQDPATALVTAPGQCSAQTYQLTFRVTTADGLVSCTQTFPVPVNYPAPGPSLYFGVGASTMHGAFGFEPSALPDLMVTLARRDLMQAAGYVNCTIILDDGGNPDLFNNVPNRDNARYGTNGPYHVRSATPGVLVSVGGITGGGATYGGSQGKGFWLHNSGDVTFTNIRFHDVNGPYSNYGNTSGLSALRMNGDTYGNLTVTSCVFVDNNNGLITGSGPGNHTIDSCVFMNSGTAYISKGATHSFYIEGNSVHIVNTLSMRSTNGHEGKNRCRTSLTEYSRFYDTERGSGSNQLNYPDGGIHRISHCKLQKGPNSTGQSIVNFMDQYGSDIVPDRYGNYIDPRINQLTIDNTEFALNCPLGTHNGPLAAVNMFQYQSWVDGNMNAVTLTNCSTYLAPQALRSSVIDPTYYPSPLIAGSPGITETGGITLTLPPVLDLSDPTGCTTPYARPGFLNFQQDDPTIGNQYANFYCVQVDPGFDDLNLTLAGLTIPAGGLKLNVLRKMKAYGANWFKNNSATDPRINPFGPGTTYSIVQDGQFFGAQPWAPVGRYTCTSDANGDGDIFLQTVPGAPSVDYFKLRATGPGATPTLCDMRFYCVFR